MCGQFDAIARLEAFDPQLGVLVTPLFDKARDVARGELPTGPFRGVPMLLKDLVAHSAGDPLYEGSAFLRNAGWAEREDSYLVRARDHQGEADRCGEQLDPQGSQSVKGCPPVLEQRVGRDER